MLFRVGFASLTEGNKPILDSCNDIFSNSTRDFKSGLTMETGGRTDGRGGLIICLCHINIWGYAVAQLVGYCATSRKVAGSIPDGVIGIFH